MSSFVKADTDLETDLDRWLYVLKNISRLNKIPAYLRKSIFEKLFNIAEYTNLTKEEKIMYDSSLKYKWDNKNLLDYAVKEGVERGIKEGIAEGEHKKAVAVAREMKKEGIPVAQIVKFTELSIEEIENL